MSARNKQRDGNGFAKWIRGISKPHSRSGPSGSRIPMTEKQRADRALEKEEAKKERAAERAAAKEAEQEKKAVAKRESKLHDAWRLRLVKPARPVASGNKTNSALKDDQVFDQRVHGLRTMACRMAGVRSVALSLVPGDDHLRRGEGEGRVCEFFILLHKGTRYCMSDMRKEISNVVSPRSQMFDWVPAETREWKELGGDFVVLRDESPPSKQDAKLLLDGLSALTQAAAPPQKRVYERRPTVETWRPPKRKKFEEPSATDGPAAGSSDDA